MRYLSIGLVLLLLRKVAGLVVRAVRGLPRAAAARRQADHHLPVRERWQAQSRFRRHLVINVLVGVTIALAMHGLHRVAFIQSIERGAMDLVMRSHLWVDEVFALRQQDAATPDGTQFVFVDIDEKTWQAWGEPLTPPRVKLLRLIEHAVAGQPRAIVVDVDLGRDLGPDDQELANYLARYDMLSPPPPHLILARGLRAPLDKGSMALSEPRSSALLAPIVARSSRIHWGTPLYDRDGDWVVRQWRTWENACVDGRPAVLPSVQLLAAAAVWGGAEDCFDELRRELASLVPADCRVTSPAHNEYAPEQEVTLCGRKFHVSTDAVYKRIFYAMQPPPPLALDRDYFVAKGGRLTTVRALAIADGESPAGSTVYADHVVIIGGSYADSGDIHATPVGEMPGALVVGNGVYSLLKHDGELEPLHLWGKLSVELFLIVVMSVAFARFDSFWGMWTSGVIVMVALLPISFFLLGRGVWLDFAIPLLAVQLHEMAANFEDAARGLWHGKGRHAADEV